MDITKYGLEGFIKKMLIVIFDLLRSLNIEYSREHAANTVHLIIFDSFILFLHFLLH